MSEYFSRLQIEGKSVCRELGNRHVPISGYNVDTSRCGACEVGYLPATDTQHPGVEPVAYLTPFQVKPFRSCRALW